MGSVYQVDGVGQMKIYLAGQYKRRDEFRGVAVLLERAGLPCTSRWLQETGPVTEQMGDNPEDFYRSVATVDIADIDSADAILFFSEDPNVGVVRGGRHVEFGYALAKGKKLCVIGPKENVFHCLDGVQHFADINAFLMEHGVYIY